MRVGAHSFSGLDIFTAEFGDLDLSTLTAAQLSDIATITAEKRRKERAMTYLLLNHAADATGNSPLHGALLRHRDSGAPFLYNSQGEITTSISISHCKSGACIALGSPSRQFGIDIEDATDRFVHVADKYLSDSEKSFITSDDDMLRAWTIKEAVYKAALTQGLSLRDGITIHSFHPADHCAQAEAAGRLYNTLSLISPRRCITVCIDNRPL